MDEKKSTQSTTSELLRTIGQPIRLQILAEIGAEEACVCHLEARLGLRQALISQHLMALRKAEVLTTRRAGRYVYYRLADPRTLDLIAMAMRIAVVSDEIPSLNILPDPVARLPLSALHRIKFFIAQQHTGGKMLNIKVLGPGCANCKRVDQIAHQTLNELGLHGEIEKITHYDEILALGVLNTPGLVVNDEVVCSGRIPSVAEVSTWFTTAAMAAG